MATQSSNDTDTPRQRVSYSSLTLPLAPGGVTFACFGKFPIEIRLKIWGYTLEPRVIEVGFTHYDDFEDHTHVFDTTIGIPALLHVHKESRAEGLRFYLLSQTNEFAMNTFYFYPALDTLNLIHPDAVQMEAFFEKDDCGLLSKVKNIALLPETDEGVVSFLYGSTVREVTLTSIEKCPGRYWSEERDPGCRCQARTFIEFAELADNEKEKFCLDERLVEEKLLEVNFRKKWKTFGKLACPVVRSMAICSKSKGYWSRIDKDDIEVFRWLKQDMANDSDDDSAEISKYGKILEAEVGEDNFQEEA